MITVLTVLAIAHVVGTVIWFLGWRDGERSALRLTYNYRDRKVVPGEYTHWDADDFPEFWAERALAANKRTRLAPVWEGVLVYWATAGLRNARKVRRDRLKLATQIVEANK